MNFNNPLPAEIEATMPAHYVNSIDRYEWRQAKFKQLSAQGILGVDSNDNIIVLQSDKNSDAESKPETVNKAQLEQQIASSITESLGQKDDSSVSVNDEESVSDEETEILSKLEKNTNETVTNIVTSKSKKVKSNDKQVKSKVKSADDNFEFIKSMPSSPMNALRRAFPSASASKADLLSAAIYIFTNGDCVISDKAMQLVNSYGMDDGLMLIKDEIKHLRQDVRRIEDLAQSIELCTCYNAFDRRYGSDEKRKEPKDTEFREKGNLDMLDKLRQQAKDQKEIDRLKRGREIYNSIKDKND